MRPRIGGVRKSVAYSKRSHTRSRERSSARSRERPEERHISGDNFDLFGVPYNTACPAHYVHYVGAVLYTIHCEPTFTYHTHFRCNPPTH